jgi:hypothetical protein
MEIYGYCIAKSRPFDFRSAVGDPSGLMRDLKGFTSRKIMKTIQDNPVESRREWMLWMFERRKKNSNVKKTVLATKQSANRNLSLKVFEQN